MKLGNTTHSSKHIKHKRDAVLVMLSSQDLKLVYINQHGGVKGIQ